MAIINVTSRGVAVTVDTGKLTDDIVAKLLEYGVTQKVGDAASGAGLDAWRAVAGDKATMTDEARAWLKTDEGAAKAQESTLTMMTKAVDALMKGEWAQRVAGDGVSDEVKVQRVIARTALKEAWGAKSPKWAEFTALGDDVQVGKLDKLFADNASALEPAVKAELKRREDARKAKAKLGQGLTITL